MTMSNRIAVLNDGKLQQIAPPLVCYNEPTNLFVAGFIGSPSMNFAEGELVENGLETNNFTVDLDPTRIPDVTVGDAVTLGVRPEDVHLTRYADCSLRRRIRSTPGPTSSSRWETRSSSTCYSPRPRRGRWTKMPRRHRISC